MLVALATVTAPVAAIPVTAAGGPAAGGASAIAADDPTATPAFAAGDDVESTVVQPGDGPGDGGVARPGPDANVTNVTLVSGQTVRVVEADGERRYLVQSEQPMQKIRTDDGTYVFPVGTDFDTFDRQLFNVDLLVEQGYTDANTSRVPVIVSRSDEKDVKLAGDNGGSDPGVLETAEGAERTKALPSIDATAGYVQKSDAASTFETLASADDVRQVSLDVKYSIAVDDATSIVDAERARQQYNVSGEGVRVAVIDSGIDEDHPDLNGSIVASKDFTGYNSTADLIGHGTHVAGILAGDGTASNGTYTGVAPNASLIDARVFRDGGAKTSTIISAMNWSVSQNADVMSMSLGGPADTVRSNDPYTDAVQHAVANDVTVVIAAGNSFDYGTIGSPGITKGAITVGSTDKTGNVSWFSSRGPTPQGWYVKPDVVAPGSSITSAAAADAGYTVDYVGKSGTSMATPVVSGVAALVAEKHPDWGPQRVKDTVISSADPLSGDDVYSQGAGRVNATEALQGDVVVSPGTTDFGLLTENATLTKTVTVTNYGDSTRTLNLSASAVAVDGADSANVTLNETKVSLKPNQSADVALTVNASVELGAYSGRISVDGGEHTAIFGFVRGTNVTITKQPLNAGGNVSSDYVWTYANGSTLVDPAPFQQFNDSGQATVTVVDEGAFNVQTSGLVESTGQPVVMTKEVTLPGDGTVTLDESQTVTVDLNTTPLTDRSGPLQNRSISVLFLNPTETSLYGGFVSTDDADTDAVRVLPDENLALSVQHLLVPTTDQSTNDSLDASEVYMLENTVDGVSGQTTIDVNVSALGVKELTYHRTSPSQTYDAEMGAYGSFTAVYADGPIEDRTRQTVYVSPTFFSQGVGAEASDGSWRIGNSFGFVPSAGETWYQGVNDHPYSSSVGTEVYNESLEVSGYPAFSWGAYNDTAPDSLSVYVNGTIQSETTAPTDYVRSTVALPNESTYRFRMVANNSDQALSTRIVYGGVATNQPSGDSTPPRVYVGDFANQTPTGVTSNGNVTVAGYSLEYYGNANVTSTQMFVANGSVSETPFDTNGSVKNGTAWTELDRTGNYTFEGPVGDHEGTLHVAVRAENEAGGVAHQTVFNATRVTDVPPTVRLGVNRTLNGTTLVTNAGKTVGFDASNSTDNLGIASVEWTVAGQSYTGERVNHTFTSLGTKNVTLNVTDTGGHSETVNVTVDVVDTIDPSVSLLANGSAVGNETAIAVNDTIGLDASNSTDNLGIAGYEYAFPDGSTVTSATTTKSWSTPGTRTVTLNVTDDAGNVVTRTLDVHVEDVTAPSAALSVNRSSVEVGVDDVLFNASNATDNFGVQAYRWDVDGDGTAEYETSDATLVAPVEGTGNVSVSVTVVDGYNNTDVATANVSANDTTAPTAAVTADSTTITEGSSVTLDASGSSDNDGVQSYHWDFTDDGSVDEMTTSASVSKTFNEPGTYTVNVSVRDAAGYRDSATVTITVEEQSSGGGGSGGSGGSGGGGSGGGGGGGDSTTTNETTTTNTTTNETTTTEPTTTVTTTTEPTTTTTTEPATTTTTESTTSATETTTASTATTTTTSGESTTESDGSPGFGVVLALLAVVLTALVVRRNRR